MPGVRLQALHRRYARNTDEIPGEAFLRAYRRFSRINRETVFDVLLAATTAHVGTGVDPSSIHPLLLKAVSDTNPGLSGTRFFALDGDGMQGAVNTAKGKYFEYLVADRLNRGEQVGPLLLEPGQRAELAERFNQPGWDMQIVDEHGMVVDYLQMKATQSLGYVANAIERYPDIQILATSEVSDSGLVLDSGIPDGQLREVVGEAIRELDYSVSEMFLDYFSPLLPLAVVVGMEGHRLVLGQQSISCFKIALARRGQRIVATQVAGAAVFAMGGGLLSVPAAVAGGLWFDRIFNQATIHTAYAESRDRLLALRLMQQERMLREGTL